MKALLIIAVLLVSTIEAHSQQLGFCARRSGDLSVCLDHHPFTGFQPPSPPTDFQPPAVTPREAVAPSPSPGAPPRPYRQQ
jgi:hypothetical protein